MSQSLSDQLATITADIGSLQTQITLDGPTLADVTQLADLNVDILGIELDVALSGNPLLQTELSLDQNELATIQLELCFVHGTHLLTERGEILIEDLAIGDHVVTPHGPEVSMPVRWIGQQHYEGDAARFHQPVMVRAGALGEGLPHRDLHLSGDHCLYLEGRLVPAKLLINGTSIIAERGYREVDYINIELDKHNVVLAEGVASETYLDCGNRHRFDNANEASEWLATRTVRTDAAWTDGTAFAPPLWTGSELTKLVDRLTPQTEQKRAA